MKVKKIKDSLYRITNDQGMVIDVTHGPVMISEKMEFQEVWAIYVALAPDERGSVYITHTDTQEQALLIAETLDDDDIPFGWSIGREDISDPVESGPEAILRVTSNLMEKMEASPNAAMKNSLYYMGYQQALSEVVGEINED